MLERINRICTSRSQTQHYSSLINSNSDLLLDETIAGSFADIQVVYADSYFVSLSVDNVPNAYSIEIVSSNKVALPDSFFVVEEEQEEIEEEHIEKVPFRKSRGNRVLENAPTLLEGSIVTVKGILMDTYTYDSVSAGRITVPYIWASSITPQ